jgi:hypothetical protein
MASIRDKGWCPCPRCLIPISRVQNLGTKRDMEQRQTLRRMDSDDRKWKVATARDIIYRRGYAVNSDAVDLILKEQSLVPMIVSTTIVSSPKQVNNDS